MRKHVFVQFLCGGTKSLWRRQPRVDVPWNACRRVHGKPQQDFLLSTEKPHILYEAEEWMVVHKPAGWHSVQRASGSAAKHQHAADGTNEQMYSAALAADSGPCVEDWLRQTVAGQSELVEAGLCNRLDQVTSGCIIVAKNAQARVQLRSRMSSDSIRKTYLAVVAGTFETTDGRFDLYFSKRYRGSKKVTVSFAGHTRHHGSCEWQVLAQSTITLPPTLPFPNTPPTPIHKSNSRPMHASLIRLHLIGGGQRHQIRGGMAHLGKPVLGDSQYNGPLWPFVGIALHSHQVQVDGTRVSSPTPAHIRALFPRHSQTIAT